MISLENAIRFAGVTQVGIVVAGLLIPRVLKWKGELVALSSFMRRLVWVYGGFILLTIAGFAAMSIVCTNQLAGGDALGRFVCGFIAVFWILRLLVQVLVFDISGVADLWWQRCGYHALTVGFVYLACVYGWAACFS